MRSTEFFSHLEKTSVAPVYLFKGEADLLMEEAWKKLLDKIVPAKAQRFNGERLQAKEHSAVDILERLKSLPMFGTKRLVMVQGIDAWPKQQQEAILSYLEKPHPTACLVLAASQKKGLEKLEAAVASVGIVVGFAAPTERDAPRWLQERAHLQNKNLPFKAASLLLEQVGLDLFRLERELDKLVAYVGNRETIEVGDVKEAVSYQRSFSIFELLRFVSRCERSRAVHSLRNLIRAGEPPLAILALMSRQIRILWQSKDALANGLSISELSRQLHLPQFVVKNYAQESSLFSEKELHKIHTAIRAADLALKGTGTSPELIMENLVLKISQPARKE